MESEERHELDGRPGPAAALRWACCGRVTSCVHAACVQCITSSRHFPATQAHLGRVGEERCAFARVMVFANKSMQSKAALQREAANWVEEAGTLPPGGFLKNRLGAV